MFYRDWEEVRLVCERLAGMTCGVCGARGTLVRHGYIRGAVSPNEYGIRAWRIFCDPESPHGKGCGHAPSIRPGDALFRRCFSARDLWLFIRALGQGRSVRSAWKHCRIPLSTRTAYRLSRRLELCQSVLRTCLCARSPPPKKRSAGSPLMQVFNHLQEAFGDVCAVSAYQETLQRDFLALA
jgi:hypothetical protein